MLAPETWTTWPPAGIPQDGAGAGRVVHVAVDGDRGPIQLFTVMLDYPLDASAVR
jgi:hypothetical protein